MLFSALDESANKGELLLVKDGMCRYHLRRDNTITIREIIVLPHVRGTGIGRALVKQVADTSLFSPIVARCPVALPSNRFWKALGFTLVGETKKGINEWRLDRR